jgi:HEPN domain-containing protein
MVSRGVIYERGYAAELMRVAIADLDSAEVLFRGGARRTENIFLMAQQALEKGLKSILCAYGLPVPNSHEISLLRDRLPEELDPPFGQEFNSLSEFATIRRYLEGREQKDNEVVRGALDNIRAAVMWCESAVNARLTE